LQELVIVFNSRVYDWAGIATPGGAKAYTFAEVAAATSQFKRELGRGGFGHVYSGTLPEGQEVAVKVADGASKHEEREFFNEVCSPPPDSPLIFVTLMNILIMSRFVSLLQSLCGSLDFIYLNVVQKLFLCNIQQY